MDELVHKINRILQPILDEHECDLIDVEVRGKSNARVVKVYTDKIGGISIQTCTQITRRLRNTFDLDPNNLNLGNYRIEVSSPGIDRPLKTLNDFKRNVGKVILFQYNDNSKANIQGELLKVENNLLKMISEGSAVVLPFDEVKLGKVQIKWKS